MKKIAKLLGGGPDSDEQMIKVFDLETQLAMVGETQLVMTFKNKWHLPGESSQAKSALPHKHI